MRNDCWNESQPEGKASEAGCQERQAADADYAAKVSGSSWIHDEDRIDRNQKQACRHQRKTHVYLCCS